MCNKLVKDMSIKYVTCDEMINDKCELFFDLDNIENHSISELQFILGKHKMNKSGYVSLAKKKIYLFREHNRNLNIYKLKNII